MVIQSLDGVILDANEEAALAYGWTQEELIGQPFNMILPPECHEELGEVIGQSKQGKVFQDVETSRLDKSGNVIPVLLTVVPVTDEAGRPLALACIARNITDLKRAEQQQRKYAAQLDAANQELEAFSYSVAHDLRTPLRALDGFSLALVEDYTDKLDEKGHDYLGRIRAASQHMGRLIDDLLELSRVARSPLNRRAVDLSALAEDIAQELRSAGAPRDTDLVISPGLVANADERLLRIVLTNLLGNAWKFTESQPHALIEFGVEELEGQVPYFVRDDGAGFDMAHVGQLFTPFQRLHSRADFPGNGIGLSLTARIIERHGGRIWAEGAEGQGATFHFTLSSQK